MPGFCRLTFSKDHFQQKLLYAFLADVLKGILPFQTHSLCIEFLILFHGSKDKHQGFVYHSSMDQRSGMFEDLSADNPFQQLIFILEMIIKRRPYHSRLIRNRLDGNFLNRGRL